MKSYLLYALLLLFAVACESNPSDSATIQSAAILSAPSIDGKKNDDCWSTAPSVLLDKNFEGKLPHATDYMGKFKICWDANYIYILGEAYDDSLVYPDSTSPGDHFELILAPKDSTKTQTSSIQALLNQKLQADIKDSIAQKIISDSKIAVNRQDKSVVFEIAIKKSPLLEKTFLKNGNELQFALTYHDFDKPGVRKAIMSNLEKKALTGAQAGWVLQYSKLILNP
ncbi:MAG: CBM9 family sugar-binding protein [Chitinophagaceae bacterium]|nr:CBM9 family sugar-binding protein [Chitinophagaceae bacterium]